MRRPRPVIAVVYTRDSPCRCGAALLGGVRRLGMQGMPIAVEEILEARDEIAAADLVIEHADTYRGRGDLRPLVRHWIEAWGGRLAGSPAAAAQRADDKIEAQRLLRTAGLRVPRSRLLAEPFKARNGDSQAFPVVLKRPFEHGSRGVALVSSPRALRELSRKWLGAGDGCLLLEEFVEGRELAVGVIETASGTVALPAVEVRLPRGRMYSDGVKWAEGTLPIGPAGLARGAERALAGAVLRAFRALGLRDYARFDVRLVPGGIPCFLEANVRPSVESGTELRLAARLAGLSFEDLLAGVLESAARRHESGRLKTALGDLRASRRIRR